MDFLSILAGVDSLRKLAVIAGLVLICLGISLPVQKTFELNDKKIILEESKSLNSVDLQHLDKEVKKMALIIGVNTEKVSKLNSTKDSLLKCSPNEGVKTKLEFVEKEIASINANDGAIIAKNKEQILNLDKGYIKENSLNQEVKNLQFYIHFYVGSLVMCLVLGLILFISGLRKWNASQKQSDELKRIEVGIKAEELKKAQRENTP